MQQPLQQSQIQRVGSGPESGPESSDSDNERPGTGDSSSGDDNEDEFDPRTTFDNWIVSLSLLDQKMMSVLLQKHFKIKARSSLDNWRKPYAIIVRNSWKTERGKSLFNDEKDLRSQA